MKTTLVIMAAGIGSRFGTGIKQLTKMNDAGEIIIDYSIYDAKEAGFDKVVFVIRHAIEEEFKEVIGNRIEKVIPVDYVYQELEDIPEGFTVPVRFRKAERNPGEPARRFLHARAKWILRLLLSMRTITTEKKHSVCYMISCVFRTKKRKK